MKRKTIKQLDRELSILGCLLGVCAVIVFPFYIGCLLKYKKFAADIAGDDNFSFSHELSVDIMEILGFVLAFAFPVCFLGVLFVGLGMVLNVQKRKQLRNSQEQLPNQ